MKPLLKDYWLSFAAWLMLFEGLWWLFFVAFNGNSSNAAKLTHVGFVLVFLLAFTGGIWFVKSRKALILTVLALFFQVISIHAAEIVVYWETFEI